MYGAVASLGATAYVLTRLRRMRERLTAEAVARVSALSLADLMALAGRRLARVEDTDGDRIAGAAGSPDVTVAQIGVRRDG